MYDSRVIYGKIGRSLLIEPRKFGPVGGDNEPLALLETLAARHPTTEFVVGCRWGGGEEAVAALPPNVTLPPIPRVVPRNTYKDGKRTFDISQKPWDEFSQILKPYFDVADGVIMWAGQMGTSNVPIPRVEDPAGFTNPQDAFMTYVGPTTLNINWWRDTWNGARSEVWLCADARNYLKCRDLKWPPSEVIGQHDESHQQKHYRWSDWTDPATLGFDARWDEVQGSNVWVTQHEYRYGALEIVGIPTSWNADFWEDFAEREPFGILINEARSYVGLDRKSIMRDWVLPWADHTAIRGKWSAASEEELGISPLTLKHDLIPDYMAGFTSTFTTPSSGSRWATTKWHEAALLGTICFCHPAWDGQGHVIPTLEAVDAGVLDDDPELKHLTRWLRVCDGAELEAKVKAVSSSRETYEWLRDQQYARALKFQSDQRAVKEIESRIPAWCDSCSV